MAKGMQVGFGAGSPRSLYEGLWARNRPADQRPPAPKPGDLVLYRANGWGPLVDAQIVAVWWRCEDGFDNTIQLRSPDPWPRVRLAVAEPPPAAKILAGKLAPGSVARTATLVDTWEARLEGAAGWLPLDHERWPRPETGYQP